MAEQSIHDILKALECDQCHRLLLAQVKVKYHCIAPATCTKEHLFCLPCFIKVASSEGGLPPVQILVPAGKQLSLIPAYPDFQPLAPSSPYPASAPTSSTVPLPTSRTETGSLSDLLAGRYTRPSGGRE